VAGRGLGLPLEFENVKQKKVVFLVLSGKKNKFYHFGSPPGKNLEKSPSAPPPEKILPTPFSVLIKMPTERSGQIKN